jgi:hypothetical protein
VIAEAALEAREVHADAERLARSREDERAYFVVALDAPEHLVKALHDGLVDRVQRARTVEARVDRAVALLDDQAAVAGQRVTPRPS